ncbi:hypothetical protein [Cellulomonas sp. ATA003]|uniref:hypothetical protein n=1 Tax=Cellulomonas sp. ATA003 TaxID=3073064 RepID=UPI002873456F|nr:hypothetical protein [Cellulomonas sp. ATA003]WNB84684.1 hypothetical protein REH70_12935 [Cellulomonas sp. ATA003]
MALVVSGCAGTTADPDAPGGSEGSAPDASGEPGPSGPTEDPEPSTTAPRPTPTQLPLPDRPDPPSSTQQPAPDDLTAAAVLDLAAHLGVPAEEVSVVRVEEVTWPDGSLGCPEPGVLYTQAIIDGTLIVLGAGGSNFRYHASEHHAPFLCEADGAAGSPDL